MHGLKKIVLIVFLFILPFFLVKPIFSEDNPDKAQNLQEEIRDLEKKITETQDRRKSLSSQITYMNNQIKLAELQIADTENQINKLQAEIDSLSDKIEKLETSLSQLSEVLLGRITETYKNGKTPYLEFLFSTANFSNFLTKFKYIQIVQTHDKLLMYQIQDAKNTFSEKRQLREVKKQEQEDLKKKLLSQKSALDSQKKEKENLLRITQNDEKRYQELRAEALKELNQIQSAAEFLKAGGKPYRVKRGDIIGLQGSTGHSTGPHLHFGVYNYASIDSMPGDWYYTNYVDPLSILSSRGVIWDEGCGNDGQKNVGSGSWEWPIHDSFEISQGFGYTCYSNSFYNGNPHPALDIVGPNGTTIHAVEEGDAYSCHNCLGDGGNGVFIFHPNGKMTLYWHLQ